MKLKNITVEIDHKFQGSIETIIRLINTDESKVNKLVNIWIYNLCLPSKAVIFKLIYY
jgi:uncharacterized protein YlaN (UPF0358 family)